MSDTQLQKLLKDRKSQLIQTMLVEHDRKITAPYRDKIYRLRIFYWFFLMGWLLTTLLSGFLIF
jgi:hypothetical protein